MTPHRKIALGFGLGLLAVVVLLALAPVSRQSRLSTLQGDGRRVTALYDRIVVDPTPIDVAFIGSSHTVNGVDAAGEQAALAALGVRARVANLGMFVMGRDLQLFLVRQLVTHKGPKVLVVEINEHVAPLGHPYLPYVGDASDMIAAGAPLNLPKMFLLFLKEQMRGVADAVLPGRAKTTSPLGLNGWQPLTGVWSGARGAPSLGDRLQARFGPRLRLGIYSATSYYEDGAVRRIVDLAKAHGVQVVFLYLPEYRYAADPDPALLRRYARLAPVVAMPRALALDRSNWFDHAHLNQDGARRLTPALTRALAPYLTSAERGHGSD
ncbi:MAG: hypothetical protein ACYDD1_12460 [Caulobacteraceae bacterium]